MTCPECGAVLVFDEEHGQYDCLECGECFEPDEVEA